MELETLTYKKINLIFNALTSKLGEEVREKTDGDCNLK